jgi:solute carrier family 25 carnitine/acylcarnitine transporter 20/29
MEQQVPPAPPARLSGFHEAWAGALGGASGVLFGHPLDTIRTRQQQPGAPGSGRARAVLAQLLRVEGAGALFKGLSSPLVASSAQNALCFHSYAVSRELCAQFSQLEGRPTLCTALAGCAAGAATSLLVTPVDLLKTQLQVSVGASRGPLALAASIIAREGPRGMYRGAAITFLRDIPSSGVYFVAYDIMMRKLGSAGDGPSHSTLLAGGIAGVCSWMSIYPLDVAKSRIQADPQRWNGVGWLQCLRRSVAAEGPAVLWRGLAACLARAFVVNAAIFSGYEAGVQLCRGAL